MAFFNFPLEYEFLIEDTEVRGRFSLNSYKTAYDQIINESFRDLQPARDISAYAGLIDRAVADLTTIVDKNPLELFEFYDRIKFSNIENKGIVINIYNINEVKQIKPQYLTQVVNNIKVTTDKLVRRQVKYDDVREYTTGDYSAKIKKQIARANIDPYTDIKSIIRMERPDRVDVNKIYIQTTIIPFLKNFNTLYAEVIREAELTKKTVVECDGVVDKIMTVYNKYLSDIEKGLTTRFLLESLNRYYEIRSYLIFLLIRKMNILSNTLVTYFNLYNTITNLLPEGTAILHESVLDGDLHHGIDDFTLLHDMTDSDRSVIALSAQKLLDMVSHQISTKTNSRMIAPFSSGKNSIDGMVMDNPSSDEYVAIAEIFKSISSRLDDFENAIMSGDTFNDAQDLSGFTQSLSSKYSTIIANFSHIDTDSITDGNDKVSRMYSELKAFIPLIDLISKNVKICNNKLKNTKQQFIIAQREQSNDVSIESLQEAEHFMEEMSRQLNDITVVVSKALISRLDCISDGINMSLSNDIPANTIVSDDRGTEFDYTKEAYDDIVNEMTTELDQLFTEYSREFKRQLAYIQRGENIVFEAETSANNTSVNGQTNTPQNTGTSSGDKSEEFNAWFDKIFNKITGMMQNLVIKFSPWLKNNKDKLQSVDYSKLSLSLPPYNTEMTNKIHDHASTIANAVRGLNKDTVFQMSDGQLLNKIFSFAHFNSDDKLAVQVRNFYKFGTPEGKKSTTTKGVAIKKMVDDMISYCEGYRSQVENARKSLKQISDAFVDFEKNINKNINESTSLFFEADDNADSKDDNSQNSGQESQKEENKAKVEVTNNDGKTEEQKNVSVNQSKSVDKSRVRSLKLMLQYYTTAVPTAMQDKWFAYTSTMKKILAASTNSTDKDSEENNGGNNEANNNNTKEDNK